MGRMSMKMKMAVGFGTLLVILVAAGLVGLWTVGKLAEISHRVDDIMTKTEMAFEVELAVEKQTTGVRGYLLAGKEELLKHDEEGKTEYRANMEQLDKRLVTDEGKKLYQQIDSNYDSFRSIVDREIELRRSGRAKEAVDLAFSPRTTEARNALRLSVAELTNLEARLKKEALEEQAKTEGSARVEMITLSAAGLIVGLVVATVISRSIAQGISRMVAMIQAVASNNLAVEDLQITSADEIGSAARSLNTMKNGLRDMIQSIAGTAEHVAAASEEISSSATQQAQAFETQKDQTIQVATAMQEMSSTVQQVSENSNRAADAARQAADTARHGGSIVDETLAKMGSISAAVSGTARKMEELGKSSDQIGRIIGVIDDIADQTNLLALNAAIEAARAGEQGRGFAVVADEVRKLAERTTTATKEIAQMIKNIQDETRSAVTAMEEGTRQVDEGVNTTAKAGQSLQEIIQTSEQVGEMITHIATAATEQSSATEQVNHNMDEISKLVRESAVGVQQSAKACQDLSGLALDLQRMVGNFKLEAGSAIFTGGSGNKRQGHAYDAQQETTGHEAEVARAFAAGSH